jgi:hypothetical protein
MMIIKEGKEKERERDLQRRIGRKTHSPTVMMIIKEGKEKDREIFA